MYLRVLVCEITHVQYEISVVSTLKFWEKGLSFWASSVVDSELRTYSWAENVFYLNSFRI